MVQFTTWITANCWHCTVSWMLVRSCLMNYFLCLCHFIVGSVAQLNWAPNPPLGKKAAFETIEDPFEHMVFCTEVMWDENELYDVLDGKKQGRNIQKKEENNCSNSDLTWHEDIITFLIFDLRISSEKPKLIVIRQTRMVDEQRQKVAPGIFPFLTFCEFVLFTY